MLGPVRRKIFLQGALVGLLQLIQWVLLKLKKLGEGFELHFSVLNKLKILPCQNAFIFKSHI